MRQQLPTQDITMEKLHFLLVSLPFQGHLNPTLGLATKLIGAGARVTLVTTINGLNNLKTHRSLPGLSYDSFEDGGANGKPNYFEIMKLVGSVNFKNLLLTKIKIGERLDFIIYGLCLPWVAEVAHEYHVPSACLFFQSAAAFSMVYHFFKSDSEMVNSHIEPNDLVQIPGLPMLKHSDIPAYLQPSNAYNSAVGSLFQQQIRIFEENRNSFILINTFQELEEAQVKKAIPKDHINILYIGPLVSNCDISQNSERESCLKWLDTKPKKSVIYACFGSLSKFNKEQNEEIYQGLVQYGHPFLLVIRDYNDELVRTTSEYDGMIVRWCSQVDVLNHGAVVCFVSHCGWNSVMESLVSGVPLVGCPQLADQMINAKMVDEIWKNGVKAVADCDGVVTRKEIKRCLEMVIGNEEIKNKCEVLKNMAMEAVAEGGAADRNLMRLLTSSKTVS
ncbi:phloretin 4'-O-glucosyltransferase-like [Rutidosis leptorrhynchoides]|uniref:phloretin 4'-O-glucosyltransferase-like n=1 Tax=Rutidosis leptorrhynchoides TaxID=125765 RepID=UPI003A9957E8